MNKITVIIPNRNRMEVRDDGSENSENFINCLNSIDKQTYRNFEMLIVDGGSDNYEVLKEYFGDPNDVQPNEINKKIIQRKLVGDFNKPLLNNIGIRSCTTKYAMTTDADMLFSKNFIGKVVEELEKAENVFVESRAVYLKSFNRGRVFRGEVDIDKDFPNNINGRIKKRTTCGGCQAMSLVNWHKLRGYNEKMIGWGFEDSELLFRTGLMGLSQIWLGEGWCNTFLLHQSHGKTDAERNPNHINNNRGIARSIKSYCVNDEKWGGLA